MTGSAESSWSGCCLCCFGSAPDASKQTVGGTSSTQSAAAPRPRPTLTVYLPESPPGADHLGTLSTDTDDTVSVGYSDGGSLLYEAFPGAGDSRVGGEGADDSTSETSSLYAKVTDGHFADGLDSSQPASFGQAGRGPDRQESSGPDVFVITNGSSSDEDAGYAAVDPETMSPPLARSGQREHGQTGRPDAVLSLRTAGYDCIVGIGAGGVCTPRSSSYSSALGPPTPTHGSGSPSPQAIGPGDDSNDPGVFAESSSEDGDYEEIDHGRIGRPGRILSDTRQDMNMYGANSKIRSSVPGAREPTYSTSPPLLKATAGTRAGNDGGVLRSEFLYLNGAISGGSLDEYSVMNHAQLDPQAVLVLAGAAEDEPAYSTLPHPTLAAARRNRDGAFGTADRARGSSAADPAGPPAGEHGYVNSTQAKEAVRGVYARARAAPPKEDMPEHPYSNIPSPSEGGVPEHPYSNMPSRALVSALASSSQSPSGEAGYINSTMANEAVAHGGLLIAANSPTTRPRRYTADSREGRYSSANATAAMLSGTSGGTLRPRAATIGTPGTSPGASIKRGVPFVSGQSTDRQAFSSAALEEAMARPLKSRASRPVYKLGSTETPPLGQTSPRPRRGGVERQDSFKGFDDDSGGGSGNQSGSKADGKGEFVERSRPLTRGGGESFRGFTSSIKLNDALEASVET